MKPFQVNLFSCAVLTPQVTYEIALEMSRALGCTTWVSGYMAFVVQDCAFDGRALKDFVKTAYKEMLRPEVLVTDFQILH